MPDEVIPPDENTGSVLIVVQASIVRVGNCFIDFFDFFSLSLSLSNKLG